MSNFIEVVIIRDTQVLDGIIHGANRRDKDALELIKKSRSAPRNPSVEQSAIDLLKQNCFAYIDVTQNAANASLYSVLKRADAGFITYGIKDMANGFRGRSLNSPSVIFSDNLEIISEETLTKGLYDILSIMFASGRTFKKPFRVYCSSVLSDKFSKCISDALYKYNVDGIGRIFPYSDCRPMPISAEEIHRTFLEGAIPSKELERAKCIVLSPVCSHLYTDLLLDKIWAFCQANHMDLHIPADRYRKYILDRSLYIGVVA